MGTRNITVVIKDNKVKISQYGQWDGYYEWTGRNVLQFCRENLSNKILREKFAERVDFCKQASAECNRQIDNAIDKFSRENGKNFVIPLNQLFPQMSRDTGWKILEIIEDLDMLDFDKDENKVPVQYFPLHLCFDCDFGIEYTNVIDLDTDTVYMLTSHPFKSKALDTTDLIAKTYTGQYCYLKFKLGKVPSKKKVDAMVRELGLLK